MRGYLIIAATSILLLSSVVPFIFEEAYGHGLGMEMTPTASLGNRKAFMQVNMQPSTLFAETPQEAIIEFKLIDANTNNPIEHATFFIKMSLGDRLIMMDWFHAHDGDLLLKVRPSDTPQVRVNAVYEPLIGRDIWVSSKEQTATLTGPIFLEGGLYKFDIEVHTIDTDKSLVDPPVTFNAFVSIGETSRFPVTNGGEHEIEVRTYYDKIKKLEYDDGAIKFSMPLSWNKDYLSNIPLIHEELVIPRTFEEFVADKYTGTINGVKLPEGAIVADTASEEGIIIHYMLTNQHLLKIADHVQAMGEPTDTANFVLVPGEANIGMPLDMSMGGSGLMAMSKTYHTMLSWAPQTIMPNTPTQFTFNFMDMKTGAMLNEVSYDFVVMKDGNEIVRKAGKTIGGNGVESVVFNDSHAGSITIRLENINGSNESVEFKAVVTPEFPLGVFGVMAGIIATMLFLTRYKGRISYL